MIRTRIAPSPTGDFHIGTLATLLRNYAFAKQNKGRFIVRIEDTDQNRKVEGSVQKILDTIKAYGLSWDEGPDIGGPYAPYVQSKRLKLYRQYTDRLIQANHAYPCFCTKERLDQMRTDQQKKGHLPKYDRHCLYLSAAKIQKKLDSHQDHVIRLKLPQGSNVTFTDLVRGPISFSSDDLDDQVLLKSDGYPTYHLAVVVDDHLMKISHVIRGEEWISSTPKHILIYQALGWKPPVYAHTPVFLDPSGKGKMSKRHGTVSAQSFLEQGYLPEAVLNFLMIMGWAPNNNQEVLSLDDFIRQFKLKNISKKSVVFDLDKLNWLNGIYLRKLTDNHLKAKLKPFLPAKLDAAKLDLLLPLIKDRLVKLSDAKDTIDFIVNQPQPDTSLLLKKSEKGEVLSQLTTTQNQLDRLSSWTSSEIEKTIRSLQDKRRWKKSQYFMMLRVALIGKTATPPLFETIELLDQKTSLNRLAHAQKLIAKL